MKLQNKLFLINFTLVMTILIVALFGCFLGVRKFMNVSTELTSDTYIFLNNQLIELQSVYTEAGGSALTEDKYQELFSPYQNLLNESGYQDYTICLVRGDKPIYAPNKSFFEKQYFPNYLSHSATPRIQVRSLLICGEITANGDTIVIINTLFFSDEESMSAMFVYFLCVLLISLGLFVVMFIVEYVVLMPRMYKLKDALENIYRGEYDKKIDIEHKLGSKDIIYQIITQFERMRRQLGQLSKQKEAFDRQRGEVILGITHDLKTPLTAIQGFSKGIVDGVSQKINKTEEYAAKIYETSLVMNNLISKLNDFAKSDVDDILYAFSDTDINAVVKDFYQKYNIPYLAKNLTIRPHYSKGKIICALDKEQFTRILSNVCDNTVKYKEKEDAFMDIWIKPQGEEVEIILKDDGPGVFEYEMEYIFESYYRGDPSRTNPTTGSGLGLSIVKDIVTAHKGNVVAYNDNGLAIQITIPKRRH